MYCHHLEFAFSLKEHGLWCNTFYVSMYFPPLASDFPRKPVTQYSKYIQKWTLNRFLFSRHEIPIQTCKSRPDYDKANLRSRNLSGNPMRKQTKTALKSHFLTFGHDHNHCASHYQGLNQKVSHKVGVMRLIFRWLWSLGWSWDGIGHGVSHVVGHVL